MNQSLRNYCVPRFELSIYENVNAQTDANDTVIYRITADTEIQIKNIFDNAKKNYQGFKYRIHDYETKKDIIDIF